MNVHRKGLQLEQPALTDEDEGSGESEAKGKKDARDNAGRCLVDSETVVVAERGRKDEKPAWKESAS